MCIFAVGSKSIVQFNLRIILNYFFIISSNFIIKFESLKYFRLFAIARKIYFFQFPRFKYSLLFCIISKILKLISFTTFLDQKVVFNKTSHPFADPNLISKIKQNMKLPKFHSDSPRFLLTRVVITCPDKFGNKKHAFECCTINMPRKMLHAKSLIFGRKSESRSKCFLGVFLAPQNS